MLRLPNNNQFGFCSGMDIRENFFCLNILCQKLDQQSMFSSALWTSGRPSVGERWKMLEFLKDVGVDMKVFAII